MTVKDVYETRFSDDLKVTIMQDTGRVWRGLFGWNTEYKRPYKGLCVEIPKDCMDLEVQTLKPISVDEIVIFTKPN